MNNLKEEKNVLSAFYGSKGFVKIKQCLEIGKILFSFVDKTDTKNHIDCYMEAEEFGAILMSAIKDHTLIKALINEKAKGDQYPKAVYTSPIGGNANGNNGKPISRYFEISPGANSEVLFTAYSYPATKSETGAFIKEKGSKAILVIRIPLTFNDLKVLQYKWSFLEKDYMTNKYSLESMTVGQSKVTYESLTESEALKSESNKDSSTNSNLEVKKLKLTATSVLKNIPGKPIKVCKVNCDGKEKRLICLLDKLTDKNKLSDFENQLNARISQNRFLEFTAEVGNKGEDLYLCKFA